MSHDAYIKAVASAFTAAKLEVLDWHADTNDPRDGAIQLNPDSLQTSADEVWVGWTEDNGWHVLKIYERENGEDSRYVTDLDCCSLSNPSGVVRTICEHFGLPPGNVRDDDYPEVDFPEHSFEDDDPEFEAALAVYERPSGGAS